MLLSMTSDYGIQDWCCVYLSASVKSTQSKQVLTLLASYFIKQMLCSLRLILLAAV